MCYIVFMLLLLFLLIICFLASHVLNRLGALYLECNKFEKAEGKISTFDKKKKTTTKTKTSNQQKQQNIQKTNKQRITKNKTKQKSATKVRLPFILSFSAFAYGNVFFYH